MEIKVGQTWKTSEGYTATIIATNIANDYPIVAVVHGIWGDEVKQYLADGRAHAFAIGDDLKERVAS